MVKLSVAVMGHSSRRPLINNLIQKFPTSTVCVDDGRLGRWGNGSRALLSYDEDASHHLVIQDDALPAQHLIQGIEAWLPFLPDSILCLYSGKVGPWRRIHQKYAQNPCWLQMTDIQWGVALVVPTHAIEYLVGCGNMMPKVDNYDARLGLANKKTTRLPVLYPSPSWVDHATVESTVPGRKATRKALQFVGEDRSVLEWKPSLGAKIIRVPDFTRPRVEAQAKLYERL